MKKSFLILGFALMLFYALGVAHPSPAWARSCPGSGDFSDECDEERDPTGPLVEELGTKKVVTFGLSSDGSDKIGRTRTFTFPGNAGQLYKLDLRMLRNDDPSPGVEFCVNSTSRWGEGICRTMQRFKGGTNIAFENRGIRIIGNNDDYTYYSHLVVRLSVDQTAFNENDVVTEWTMYRREFSGIKNPVVVENPIQVGEAPILNWTVDGASEDPSSYVGRSVVFMEGPAGQGGFWNTPNQGPWMAEALTIPGSYNYHLEISGPKRFGGEERDEWDGFVTVQGGGACNNNRVCDAGENATTCPLDCNPGGGCTPNNVCDGGENSISCPVDCNPGRYKCSNNACTWDPNDSGNNQCQFDYECSTGDSDHRECVNNACAVVPGPGADSCTTNAQCVQPTHNECRNNACVSVPGGGQDTCGSDAQCVVTPGDCAEYVSESGVPATMIPGETAEVSVTMRNCGTSPWTPLPQGEDVNTVAGYKLGSQNPRDNFTWGLARVGVPNAVPPTQQGTFTFNITAPFAPGVYDFMWQMVNEHIRWFVERTPATPNTAITVVDCAPGAPGCAKHLECVSNACAVRDGVGPNEPGCAAAGNSCTPCDPGTANCWQRLACNVTNACVRVHDAPGTPNSCSTEGGACPPAGQHLGCAGNACAWLPGGGGDVNGCTAVGQSCVGGCVPGTPGCSHNACLPSGACTQVAGGGSDQCASSTNCVQPPPGCGSCGPCEVRASPERIVLPTSPTTTLAWQCGPPPFVPPTCTLNGKPVSTNGSQIVSPTSTTTYTYTCSNESGSHTSTLTVRVFQNVPGGIIEVPPGGAK